MSRPSTVRVLPALALVAAFAHHAPAQSRPRWIGIGRTGSDNPVELDTRSVRVAGGITTAALRVRFVKPVASPRGPLTSARTIAMFDCAKRHVAVKENWYYHDERANRVYEHKVVAQPGWSTAIGGSMPAVALDHLCKR